MEWTISFLPNHRIIIIQTHGIADEASSREMAKSISKTMAEHKLSRCLIDHTMINSVSGSVLEIYNRPQELHQIGVSPIIKIAEVVHPAHKDHFSFLETVCINNGFDFRIFDGQESALRWLTE
jgi:hypothetical protein